MVLGGVVGCKDKDKDKPQDPAASTAKDSGAVGATAPGDATPAGPARPDAPTSPTVPGDPAAADAGAVAAAIDHGDDAIAAVCERSDACKCPVPDCRTFFTDLGMADSIFECLAAQPCEVLCAPRAGAPGTPLHAACIEGKTGSGGGVTTSCRTDNDCPARHECCGGYCYEMGTSLWITACQMPTGEF